MSSHVVNFEIWIPPLNPSCLNFENIHNWTSAMEMLAIVSVDIKL